MNGFSESKGASRLLRITTQWKKPRRIISLTLFLLLAGLAWRCLRYVLCFPLWGDEAFLAINLMTRDFSGLIGSIEYNQIVPLGFMWLQLAMVNLLGEHEYILRLIPFLASLASLIFFWKWIARILPRREVLLSVGIFAGSFYLVRHGTELKPYSLDLFLAVLLNRLVWEMDRQPSNQISYIGLIFLSILGPWISYPFIFIASGLALFLGIQAIQRKSEARWRISATLAIFSSLSFLAHYIIQAVPQSEAAPGYFVDWGNAFPPISEPWKIPWWLIKIHTGAMMAYPIGGNNGGSIFTLLLVLLGLMALWKRGDRTLIGFLLLPLSVTFLSACLHKYPYGTTARTMLFMAPAFCLLAGVGLAQALKIFLPKRLIGLGVISAAGFIFLIMGSGALVDIIRPYKELPDYHLRQAFQGMIRQSSSHDQWIVFSDYGPRSPDGLRIGGGGAVFRYYLMVMIPSLKGIWPACGWPPKKTFALPDEIQKGLTTHVLVYRGDRGTLNEFQWIAYLQSLNRRIGPSQRRVYYLKRNKLSEGKELSIETYTFIPQKRP
jgi:hypothetical protein